MFDWRNLYASLLVGLAALASPAYAEGPVRPRLEAIREAGMVAVCIWPDYYAISFRNPRNDRLEGIDIDLSQALASDLGVAVRYVETTFASFMDDLEARRCDVAMFGVGVTEARRKRVDFSEPYLRSGIYAIVAKVNRRITRWDDIDRPGVIVAVQAGTFMEPAMRGYLRAATVTVVRPPQTREDEVLSGRADAFATDYPYGKRMLFQHDWARLIEPPSPLSPTSYAYAVARGEGAWLTRLNEFVRDVRQDGRLLAAARRHGLEAIILN
ncbi:cyclohexadienyl dehydratase [Allostella sp. ATCC 35155]|nr:cyclohexadienyl dehydratase [Stella sp. ATCC 35155]